MAVVYMTEEGYKKLIEQIKQLESVERPRISAQIAEARDKGDLSENAEYDAAKEAQGLLEMKISQLKDTLSNALFVVDSKSSFLKVKILFEFFRRFFKHSFVEFFFFFHFDYLFPLLWL